MSARLVVSVHDVGPASATPTAIWLDALDRRGLRSSLLVIPGRWRGDSLADRRTFQRLLYERQTAFTHTTTHTAVVDLVSRQQLRGFAFSHRPGGAGERAAAHLLRAGVRAAARAAGLVRIALHPDDLSHPGLRDATLAAIDEALDLGAAPATYGELLASAAVS
jgi:predicted deacetylase